MIDLSTAYVPLVGAAGEWARRAGMPPPMVLRRLCEWAVVGAFPDGAFVDAAGLRFAPYGLYMSAHAISETSPFSTGIHIGGRTIYGSNWGLSSLNGVLLTAQDLRAFCDKTNTLPPDPLLSLWERLKAKLVLTKHLAPPPCPDAEAYAIAWLDHEDALASLDSLRRVIESAQGRSGLYGYRSDPDDPFNVPWWTETWEKRHTEARQRIDAHGDPDLKRPLEALEREWAEVLHDMAARSTARVEPEAADPIRLRMRRAASRIILDGQELALPAVPFKVLSLLAERAQRDDRFVSNQDIDQHLWGENLAKVLRDTRDVIRDLRDRLSATGLDRAAARRLIEGRVNHGYRLALSREQIIIED